MNSVLSTRRLVGAAMIGLSSFALTACGGKPSEGEIHDKLVEVLTHEKLGGLSEDDAQKVADCMAPKLADSMSEDGLESLMDDEPEDIVTDDVGKISKEDEEVFKNAASDCSSEVTG